MLNEKKEIVDSYIPRKCMATNKILGCEDHACVQISIPQIDSNGVIIPGKEEHIAFSGYVRDKSVADQCFNKVLFEKKYITFKH